MKIKLLFFVIVNQELGRRNFIKLSLGLGLGASAFGAYYFFESSPKYSDIIIGGGKALINGKPTYFLSVLNLKQNDPQPRMYRTDFLPHGIAFHTKSPHIISLFEKKGPHACEFDLFKKEVTRPIEIDSTRHFYGHGVYSVDGRYLFSTETDLSSESGAIVIRDASSLKIEGLFPTYGDNPHDCQLIDNGTTLAITNGGSTHGGEASVPCVSYVDIKSHKLIEKFKMMDPRFNAGHLSVSKNRQLVVSSAPHPTLPEMSEGAFSMVNKESILQNLNTSDAGVNLRSETLSISIDEERQIVGTTSPMGDSVSFWSLSNGQLVSHLKIEGPRGITLTSDNRYYAVSYGNKASLMFIDSKTLKPIKTVIPYSGLTGSHLYVV